MTGGTPGATARTGNSVDLTGRGYLEVPDAGAELDPASGLTVEAWVWPVEHPSSSTRPSRPAYSTSSEWADQGSGLRGTYPSAELYTAREPSGRGRRRG